MSAALLVLLVRVLMSVLVDRPRPMFWCQVIATVVAGTVQLGVQSWVFSNIEDLCTVHQKDHFICPSTTVFGTASIIWGVIGPRRIFSSGQLYSNLMYFFLIGAGVPVVSYFVQKRFPHSFLRYVNWPVVFTGTGLIPPATPANYASWCFVGFIFNYVIRRRSFSWWAKYNCAFRLPGVVSILALFADVRSVRFEQTCCLRGSTQASRSRRSSSSSACSSRRRARSASTASARGGETTCTRTRRTGTPCRSSLSRTAATLGECHCPRLGALFVCCVD